MPRLFGRPVGWLCWACLSCNAAGPQEGGPPFEVEVASVAVCEPPKGPSPKPGSAQGQDATPATLGVKMRVTGRYQDRVPANYFYASLVSRDGTRYLPTVEGCRPLLAGRPLLPGETREGYANFPIAAQRGALRLAYAPNLEHTRGAGALPANASTIEVPLP